MVYLRVSKAARSFSSIARFRAARNFRLTAKVLVAAEALKAARTPTIFRATPERLQRLPTCSGVAKGGCQATNRIAACVGRFDQRLLSPALAQSRALVLGAAIQGAAAADRPVLIISWDQVGLIRVLAEYTSCAKAVSALFMFEIAGFFVWAFPPRTLMHL